MLQGVIVKQLETFVDERGFFTELFRADNKEIFSDEIVQANLSITYPGIIRAWHRHEKGQVDYFIVIKGVAKICAYDDDTKELNEIISTERELQVVRLPGHYWHGFKAIGNEPAYLVYFANRFYDQSNPDEIRRPWDDPKIIPSKINDKTNDPRCGKSWDWKTSPNK